MKSNRELIMVMRTRPCNLQLLAMLIASTALAAGCSSPTISNHPTQRNVAPAAQVTTQTPGPSTTPTPTTTSTPALPDPCALLTRPEAGIVAGADMNPGEDIASTDPATDPASCTYYAPFTGPSAQVEIYVSLNVPRALEIDRAVKHTFRNVPDIGDETIEEPDNNNIFIRKGRLWVYLTVAYGVTPASMEDAARLITSRLP